MKCSTYYVNSTESIVKLVVEFAGNVISPKVINPLAMRNFSELNILGVSLTIYISDTFALLEVLFFIDIIILEGLKAVLHSNPSIVFLLKIFAKLGIWVYNYYAQNRKE